MLTKHQKSTIFLMAVTLLGACFWPTPAQGAGPIGELSTDCTPGFHLVAMPTQWSIVAGTETPLSITTHVAVDFDLLNPADYRIIGSESTGEPVYDLIGYPFMVLDAEIRTAGEASPLRNLAGLYTMDKAKQPVLFTWDLRDGSGRAVAPGLYEIEVRGRFVPEDSGLSAQDDVRYAEFDSDGSVVELCTRTLTIEVVEPGVAVSAATGKSCADPPSTYYDTVDASSAATLRNTLHDVIDDHTRFTYTSTGTDTWDILNDADENPSNLDQLLTVYKNEDQADGCSSGCDWNREHTWAKSYGFSEESGNGRIPYTDCHHLRAANPGYNSSRGNRPFNDCVSGCSSYPVDVNNGYGGNDPNYGDGDNTIACPNSPTANDLWEPWDHRKGDVARSMMYMDLRYEGDSGALGPEQDLILTDNLALMTIDTVTCNGGYQDPGYLGVLSTLVAWALADPPDADEMRRNDEVWCYQANRNPFVDHPEWVNCLYNDICSDGGPGFGGIESVVDPAPCAATGVQIGWSQPFNWNDSCSVACNRGYTVYRDAVEITTGGCASASLTEASTSCTDTSGSAGVTHTYRVEAFNHDSNTADGGTTIDIADLTDDGTGPSVTAGPSATAYADNFVVTWSTDEPADSELRWGTSMGGPYPSNVSDVTAVSTHQLTANALDPDTTFYYQVCSTDVCGNGPTCSAEQSIATVGGCDPGANTGVFVNELHYDNESTDTGEFIEVAGPAGTDLGDGPWTFELYTGNGGTIYDTVLLSGTIDDEGTGYGAVAFSFPSNGIQNGSPDGLALIDGTGTLVQFLCYEGTFTATEGVANGVLCTDIGVEEPANATPAGQSLQLTGGPDFVYEGFTWTGPLTDSPGDLNAGQTMECDAAPPTDIFSDDFESSNMDAWSAATP